MLDAKKFGLAAGILWGACLFVFTIIAYFTGYAYSWLMMWSHIYLGYNISLLGSIVGLVYGFFDGFVCFFLFAWLYNKLLISKH